PFQGGNAGSNPVGSTGITEYRHGPVAQLVSASPCHGEGRGFESRQGRNGVPVVDRRPGQVAQLVERPPEKRKVAGSTPALATSRRIVPASVGAIFLCPEAVAGGAGGNRKRGCRRSFALFERWPLVLATVRDPGF